jgi:uncharacterized protein (TIGR00730 family)
MRKTFWVGDALKVCICGGTNPATNPKWTGFATKFGEMLCKNKFEMVWGGNAFGVLSNVHKEYIKSNTANTLIVPHAYENDLKTMTTDKVIKTELVVERTHEMFLLADVVVFVPGGIGTIYEFWSAVEGKRAGQYNFEIIMLNYNNFFQKQLEFFEFINENGFTKTGAGGAPYAIKPEDLFTVFKTHEEVVEHLKKIVKTQKKI